MRKRPISRPGGAAGSRSGGAAAGAAFPLTALAACHCLLIAGKLIGCVPGVSRPAACGEGPGLASTSRQGRDPGSYRSALAVPGSEQVKREAEEKGLHSVLMEAGFEWRDAGCSMCLAMNPDKLEGRQVCASTSNRNFKGRQGSSTGRTLLMSPASAAAAAVEGSVADPRETFKDRY